MSTQKVSQNASESDSNSDSDIYYSGEEDTESCEPCKETETTGQSLTKQHKCDSNVEGQRSCEPLPNQSTSEHNLSNQPQKEEGKGIVQKNTEPTGYAQLPQPHPSMQQYPEPSSPPGWSASQMPYGHHPYQGNLSVEKDAMWSHGYQYQGYQYHQSAAQHSAVRHQFWTPTPHQNVHQPLVQPQSHWLGQPQPQQFENPQSQQFLQHPLQQLEQTVPQRMLPRQGSKKTKAGVTSLCEQGKPNITNSKFSQIPTVQVGKQGISKSLHKKSDESGKIMSNPGKSKRSDVATGSKEKNQPGEMQEKMYVCVHGIDSEKRNDDVITYIEARSRSDIVVEESLRTAENPEHAIVVFAERVDLEVLEKACDTKPLNASKMTFDEINPPMSVIVSSEDDTLTERKLQEYLKKKKMETVRVHITDEGAIIVKFRNKEDVGEILKSTNIVIGRSNVIISVMYICDHGTFWDHILHRVAIPAPYKPAHLDDHVKRFIINITSACNKHLEPHHACLSVSDDLQIICTLDKKDKGARRKTRIWKDSIENVWHEYIFINAQKRELEFTSDTKELLMEYIQRTKEEHKSEELKVYEESSTTIIFVGKSNIVENVYHQVSAKKIEIQDNLKRRNRMRTELIHLKPIETALMSKCNKFERLKEIASDLTCMVDNKTGAITLSGVQEDIDTAKLSIYETKNELSVWNVTNMSIGQCRLLSNQTVGDLVCERFESNNISAVFRIVQNEIEVCTTSHEHFKQVEKILKETIVEDEMHLDDTSRNVLKLDEWYLKISSIKNNFSNIIDIEETGNKIVVTSLSNVLPGIVDKLKEFIAENSAFEFDIPVSNEAELKYLQMHCMDVVKDLQFQNKNLNIRFRKRSVNVKGPKIAAQNARDEIDSQMSGIKKNPYTLSKLGVDSLFDNETKSASLINPIEEDSRTIILIDQNTFIQRPHHRNTVNQETDEDYVLEQVKNSYKRRESADAVAKKGGHAMNKGHVICKNGTKVTLVKKEDLAKQQGDVIVCSDARDLHLSGPLGKSLTSAAGQQFVDEIQAKYKDGIQYGDIAVVSGHKLQCKAVYLVALRNYKPGAEKIIAKCVNSCLSEASQSEYVSIIFPALGTGNLNYPRKIVAETMYRCVEDFDKNNILLKEVKFLCYDNETIKAFENEEEKILNPDVQHPVASVKNLVNTSSNVDIGSVTFWIYYMSTTEFEEAKKQIDKAVSDNYKTEHIHDKLIPDLRPKELEYLQSVVEKYPIKIEINNLRSEVILEGTTDHTMNAKQDIFDWFRKFTHTRHCEAEANIVKEQAQWFLKDTMTGAMDLIPYPPMINMHLENAHKGDSKRTDVDFKDDQGAEYIIDLKTMTEYPKNNPNDKVDVIRREKLNAKGSFEPPPAWMEQGTDNVKVVTLINTDPEYKSVEQKLVNSVKNGKFSKTSPLIGKEPVVLKIERIQNLNLFRMYAAKKSLMEKQNKNVQNEKELWHGTSESAVVSINLYGFNRSYCSTYSKIAEYGMGVYFASDALYSLPTFRPEPTASSVASEQNIYLCAVLTGVSRKGTKGEELRVLPIRQDGSLMPYDSNTDESNPPLEYVVFNDTQAYPLYRIKFQLK